MDHEKSVALYAPRPQQGKTTVAQSLIKQGFALVQFSAPLRRPLYDVGLDVRHVEGDLKEAPLPEDAIAGLVASGFWPVEEEMQQLIADGKWGKNDEILTPRDFMKARALILGERTLVYHARAAIEQAHAAGQRVVIDDLRWPSQYDCVSEFGGLFDIWRIERPTGNQQQSADSRFEGLLEDRPFDYFLSNCGNLYDLEMKVRHRLNH